MKKVAGSLRLDLAQYRELAAFAQFGSDLDKATQARLNRGKKTMEILKQGQYQPMPVDEQVVVIYCAVNGYLDDVDDEKIKDFENGFLKFMRSQKKDILQGLKEGKVLTPELEEQLKAAIEEFKAGLA
jgi:F-type H+-transporting ATPase subunit alpha